MLFSLIFYYCTFVFLLISIFSFYVFPFLSLSHFYTCVRIVFLLYFLSSSVSYLPIPSFLFSSCYLLLLSSPFSFNISIYLLFSPIPVSYEISPSSSHVPIPSSVISSSISSFFSPYLTLFTVCVFFPLLILVFPFSLSHVHPLLPLPISFIPIFLFLSLASSLAISLYSAVRAVFPSPTVIFFSYSFPSRPSLPFLSCCV